MLLRQPLDFEGKKTTKHFSAGAPSALPKPEPSPAEPAASHSRRPPGRSSSPSAGS